MEPSIVCMSGRGIPVVRGNWISIGLLVSVLAAFGLFWLVGSYADARFKESSFKSRFPEKTFRYDADKLRRLASSDVRKIYVVPLLFPLDLIVMLALAGSMGAAIWYWLGQVSPGWTILALVPLIYLVSDLAENSLLAWMLQPDNAWPDAMIGALKTLTAIKLVSVVASMIVTAGAFLLWLYRARFGNQR
jgi:hypothetical protein